MASAKTSARSGSRDNATIQANVLATAMEILLDGGLAALTVQEISNRSGVAKTTIYRRWPSAEAIGIEALQTEFTSTYPAPDTGTLEGDLGVIYVAYRNVTTEPGFRRVNLSLLSASTSNPVMEEVFLTMENQRRGLLQPMLDRAVERGEISVDLSFEQIRAIILGPIFHMRVRESIPMSDADCATLAAATCRALR